MHPASKGMNSVTKKIRHTPDFIFSQTILPGTIYLQIVQNNCFLQHMFKTTFSPLHQPSYLRVSGYLRPEQNTQSPPIYHRLLRQPALLSWTDP